MANRRGKGGSSDRFPFLGSKITADGDCMKLEDDCFLQESFDSVLKTKDITLPTKVHMVKAMVFPVVNYGCES